METINERVKQVIADTLGVDPSKVNPYSDLKKDLGADSLDVVELIMVLETEFNVSIPDEQIERMKEVRHLTDYILKVKPVPAEMLYAPVAA